MRPAAAAARERWSTSRAVLVLVHAITVGRTGRLGRHEELHLYEAQVPGKLVRVARQRPTGGNGRIGLCVQTQPWLAAGGELEDDPLCADVQGVNQELLRRRVELEIVERVEVEADGERSEIRGDVRMVDHDSLDPAGAGRFHLRAPVVRVADRLLEQRAKDVVDVALCRDDTGVDVELGTRLGHRADRKST